MVNIFSALNNTYPDAILRNPMIRNQSPISVLPTPRPSSIGAINQDFPPVPMMRPDDLLSQTNQVQEPPLNTQGSLGSGFGGLFGQNMSDPQTQGILAASSALLKGGAPSFQPTSFGGILGESINQGLGAFNRAGRRGRNNLQVVGGSLIDVSDPSNPKVVFEGRKKPKTQILGGGRYIATQDPDTGQLDIKKSNIFDTINDLEKDKKQSRKLDTAGFKYENEQFGLLDLNLNLASQTQNFIDLIDNDKLEFGLFEGIGDTLNTLNPLTDVSEETINSRNFEAFLNKLRNDTLRLNKGTQTEGDAQRALDEIANFYDKGDTKTVRARLAELLKINQVAAEERKRNINRIRKNQGVDEFDFSNYNSLFNKKSANKNKNIKFKVVGK